MSEPRAKRERIQFPLRALFIITLLTAVLAKIAMWLWSLQIAGPILLSFAVGLLMGLAAVLIFQHVELTCVLNTLLLAVICFSALWFSAQYVTYGCGLIAGAMIAWKGLVVLNALFRLCGVTTSSPTDSPPQ